MPHGHADWEFEASVCSLIIVYSIHETFDADCLSHVLPHWWLILLIFRAIVNSLLQFDKAQLFITLKLIDRVIPKNLQLRVSSFNTVEMK